VELLAERGLPAWVAGAVIEGNGSVDLHGSYPT
jgi:hypothetical protein